MKRIEYAFIFLVVFAIASKIFQLPGTSIITILSFCVYLIYTIFSTRRSLKESESNSNWLGVMLSYGVAACLLGILYIFMSWPNARLMLLIGSSVSIVLSIVLIALKEFKSMKIIILRGLIIGSITLVIVLLPKYTIFKLKHMDDPKLVELYIDMKELGTDEAREAFSDYIHEKYNKP